MNFIIWATLFANIASPVLTVPLVHADPLFDFSSTTVVENYILSQASTTPKRADFVAKNESSFVYNQRGDLHIFCTDPTSPDYGQPVYARGAFQITRCYHPEVTDAQADDVIWATAWALPRLKDKTTCIKEWTQCAIFFGVSP